MMLMQSTLPDVEYPTDLTIWEWAFEHPRWSPLFQVPRAQISGYTNATTKERLDFFQVKEHATHLSTALARNYGLQPQDTVSIFSPSSIWYPVVLFAVLRAGGRVNGASPVYGEEEMTSALQTAKTKYVFTVPASLAVALAAAKAAGIPSERVFLLEGQADGFTTLAHLLEMGRSYGAAGQAPIFRVPAGQTNDICGFLTFSSGTTGLPKAVMLSHKNVVAQCAQLKGVALPEKKIQLACLPFFHISGLLRFLMWPIASNDECIILPQFTMEGFLSAIGTYQITDLTLVPSIVVRLIRDPMVDQYDLSSVRRVACGAAPLGADVLALLQKRLPWTGFRQSYGMTESCCCLSTHPPAFYDYKNGNNGGLLLGSTTVKIVDIATGQPLGVNETGEILARGPQIAMGYLDNAAETAETFGADGFLHTGDVGKIDEHGFIHIVDRIKEMIKVKGQQVAPADLEQLLIGHDGVVDCAVIGVTDDAFSSERPKAYVVLKAGLQPSEALGRELMNYVKERRVRYKWIKEIEFIDEVPRNPSGKVLRRVLKARKQPTGLVVKEEARVQAKM